MRSRYLFKKPVIIGRLTNKPVKYKLYESNFDGYMRFCHFKNILMAGWIRLPKDKWSKTYNEANTQLEVEINWNDIISLKDCKEIGNFLQASFDIETYSYDKTFPDPNKRFTVNKNCKCNTIPCNCYNLIKKHPPTCKCSKTKTCKFEKLVKEISKDFVQQEIKPNEIIG